MALPLIPSGSAESMPPQPDGQLLASVTPMHPPQEGVFDSGTHHFFRGEVKVGRDDVVWTLEVPENLAYDGLATFVPGYSGIKGSSRAPRTALANEGIAAVSYSPARRGSWYETVRQPQVLHAKTIHRVGKAVSEIAPQAIDPNRRILVGHSMGGLGITEYAKHFPDQVELLVNLAACGYGHPNLWEIIQDVPKGAHLGIRHELIPSLLGGDIAATPRNLWDLANYFAHFRTAIESNSCLRHDAREAVAELRQQGVPVAYQAYEHDILVRPDPDVTRHVDVYNLMPNAGHLAPIRKSAQVARWIANVVGDL